MGDGAMSISETRGFADFRLSSKLVKDNVHGFIPLDQLALQFIDTEQFQRLRELKQLGVTHMVYPGAVHSRFEHSLGVYHLAEEMVKQLKRYQGPELDIDVFDVQTVKLAGLLHDVGHGPFSHMFESGFLPKVLQGSSEWSHEDMSIRLIDYIVDEHHIEIDDSMQKKVKEMVVASTAHASRDSLKEKRFLYDIVANGRNGIDVDKFDYIVRDSRACGLGCSFQFERLLQTVRVMDDEICYRTKEYLTIHKLFLSRADLHRTVYTHAKVKAIELMVVDALLKANNHLQISSAVNDPAEFWKLDDTILKRIETDAHPELKEARDLILRIRRRDLYQFCNEFTVPKERLEHFKNVTPQQIICSQDSGGISLNEEDIAVSNIKIDLTQGRNNPLKSIRFFQNYDSTVSEAIEDDRISHLLPGCCQDRIVRVYAKKPELVSAVSKAFENFQEKEFWKKVQVHATPEKNKRQKMMKYSDP
ncbi:uncharacterized protein LOC141598617 isoform X1 [Silene latifolia]|uniref:uncharacterized protein LOC141598617 isoform X1 n=1 Tax=Silene latifolia TaxID=37657 RepID=UPI003D77C008